MATNSNFVVKNGLTVGTTPVIDGSGVWIATNPSANAAFIQANAAYTQANTATTNAATADVKAINSGSYANSAYTQANGAFTTANNALPKSGGTMTGNITLSGATTSIVFNDGSSIKTANTLPRVVSITDGTSITVDTNTTDFAIQTNTQSAGTLTINAPTGTPANGQKFIIRVQCTNAQTLSFNARFTGSTDIALPSTSTGSSKYDYMGFIYNSTATKWQMVAKNFGF